MTTFTASILCDNNPAISTLVSGSVFNNATCPPNSILIFLMLVSVICPASFPICSASFIYGLSFGASSAEIDGIFNALVIAPDVR